MLLNHWDFQFPWDYSWGMYMAIWGRAQHQLKGLVDLLVWYLFSSVWHMPTHSPPYISRDIILDWMTASFNSSGNPWSFSKAFLMSTACLTLLASVCNDSSYLCGLNLWTCQWFRLQGICIDKWLASAFHLQWRLFGQMLSVLPHTTDFWALEQVWIVNKVSILYFK